MMIVGVTTTYHERENFERVNREYTDCLQRAGFLPILLPSFTHDDAAAEVCCHVDALVLTGGEDVAQGAAATRRDRFEAALVRHAFEADLPILGICRGLQMMNAALGGTLAETLPPSNVNHCLGEPYSQIAHLASFTPGSMLATLFGTSAPVNSMHHQGAGELAEPLCATALALDGVIEGIEAPDRRFFVGVQWHPEYISNHQCLFEALARAAANAKE